SLLRAPRPHESGLGQRRAEGPQGRVERADCGRPHLWVRDAQAAGRSTLVTIVNGSYTIAELLALFPNGFSVGPGGEVNKTLMASSWLRNVAQEYPVAIGNQGYLVVELQPRLPEPPRLVIYIDDELAEPTPEWSEIVEILKRKMEAQQ